MKKLIAQQIKDNNNEYNSIDITRIVRNLFNSLSNREKDILMRRFGLHNKDKETLEKVGKRHKLTRERIRQIENTSVKKLQKMIKFEKELKILKNIIIELLKEHGGLMEKDYFLNTLLLAIQEKQDEIKKNKLLYERSLDFLISKLLDDSICKVHKSKHFKSFFRLKEKEIDHLEELLFNLYDYLEKQRKILKTKEILDFIKNELEIYEKHSAKLSMDYKLDISHIFENNLFEEDIETINNNKILYSTLIASKKIEQNKFGHWGIHTWREIKPKTINDKIYLILKNNNKEPLHFKEIARRINSISFDNKKSNIATVHNELILDPKYVLVGRGLYGLREWGYKDGTVLDVIKGILLENQEPMSREEIIDKVLESRRVKKTTIILALMDKNAFERVGNKYALKKE